MVVFARGALFLTRAQLTRSRSAHAVSIVASKSATKLARQIMLVPLVVLRVLVGQRRVPIKQGFLLLAPSRQ